MRQFLFGSKMLGLTNNRDEDWITFVDKKGKEITMYGERSLPFYRTTLKHFTEGGKYIKDHIYNAVHLYQLSAGFIHGDEYPFNDFDILEHKTVWIQWLKAYMNSEKRTTDLTNKEILPKHFYHILYQYYMIVENAHWISDEAKINVQKIHDLEMPSSYFYELRDLINNLE